MDIQQHRGFCVVGLAARTNNAHEMSETGKIATVWQSFLHPKVVHRIPNKIGLDPIAIYTDYETDHTGYYTYMVGLPISSAESLPEEFTLRRIPPGRYAVVSSRRGPVKEVVREVWERIWNMTADELGGERAFHTDYEIYDQRASDPDNGQVDVYVGLR